MSQTIAEQKRARRNVYVLIAAQGLLGAQMPISFVLGGLSGQMLSDDKCFATLPISVIVLFSMLCAPFMSDIMQSRGRRTGFMIGITGGALGGLLPCIAAIIRHSVPDAVAGRMLGYSTSSQYVGQVLGPLTGGYLGGHFGMPVVFVVTSLLMAGCAMAMWLMPPAAVAD